MKTYNDLTLIELLSLVRVEIKKVSNGVVEFN